MLSAGSPAETSQGHFGPLKGNHMANLPQTGPTADPSAQMLRVIV